MARSGDFGTSNGYIVYWIEAIQNSQNIGGNTSNVTVRVWVKRTNSGYTTYGTGTVYVTINGSNYTSSLTTSHKITSSPLKIFEKTVNISHNASGEKTLGLSARISHSTFSSSSHSWNFKLSDIPRTSKPTVNTSSVNYGSAVTISTNRASGSFTHTLRYNWNGRTGTIATGVGASYSWTIPLSFMNYIPSATSTRGTIYCDTYNGNNKIGTESVSITTTVPNNIVPSFSSVTHSENVSNVSSKIGAYVQGLSKLNLKINGASGTYGSSISKYEIIFNGVTYTGSSVVSGVIKGSGTLTITGRVTDSRGRTASKNVSINVLAYEPPKITVFKVQRANADGTLNEMGEYAKVTRTGTWRSLNSKNSATIVIKTKPRGSSTWTTKNTVSAGTGGSYNASVVIGSFEAIKSHDFRLEFIDQFNTTISLVVLPTGIVTMSWGPSGIGIGKIWEKGALDILGDLRVNGYDFRIQSGIGYLSGAPAFVTGLEELWNGAYYMTDGHVARATRHLSDCPNGWILLWSDIDPPSGINDYNFVTSVIPKQFGTQFSGGGTYFPTPHSTNTSTTKYLYVYNDRLEGAPENGNVPNNDVVLRKIYGF